ncbi:MAG: Crp/Fnr family transcriptional regulator [Hydrogenophaga sp.]|uniref:Crp/Fnr family transcriptional regulator n=1 Tax=Hydrogenophaga sp. TaxID=1904254 RepID=UPI001D3C2935|nr:Crp/Fnr family transcriptional regulator [Hydrogenophaga sp.]MBX3608918.1 Crp/Fnr family transcriptional regulator [Hydrogenophaga sp.]
MNATDWAALAALYPGLGDALTPAQIDALPLLAVPAGTTLFREAEACGGFPLVLDGEVRVSRSASNGRELELYRVMPGEMCLVSSSCLFLQGTLTAHGVTQRPTRLSLLPPEVFQAALAATPFRDFVMGLFASRLTELTTLVEAVAFQRLDARLANALLGHGTQVHTTHQALADGLGTVREIVTRLLRRFEREGWVELSRECITVRDSAALRALAGAGPEAARRP